jgi:Alginate lyase
MRTGIDSATGARLEKYAAAALKAGPWSVTSHRAEGLGVAAGPHDYYSEGPYWWPDPKNPTGPYIRKDGQRNPHRFMGNRSDLGNMCTAVLSLRVGAFLLKQPGCTARAGKVLSMWFIDAATRMNPNL